MLCFSCSNCAKRELGVKKVEKIYNDGRELQSCVNSRSLSIILNRLESIINEIK